MSSRRRLSVVCEPEMPGRINHEGHEDELATKVTKNTKTVLHGATEQRRRTEGRSTGRQRRLAAPGGLLRRPPSNGFCPWCPSCPLWPRRLRVSASPWPGVVR